MFVQHAYIRKGFATMSTRQTLWLALPPIWRSLIVNSSRNGFGGYVILDLDGRHGLKLLVEDRNFRLWPPSPLARNFILSVIMSPLSPTMPLSRSAGCMPPSTCACCCERVWSSSVAGAWSCWSHSFMTIARLCPWRPWTYWMRPVRTR